MKIKHTTLILAALALRVSLAHAGQQTFTVTGYFHSSSNSAMAVAVGDLNNDGLDDHAVTLNGGFFGPPGGVHIRLAQPNGFPAALTLIGPGGTDVAIADVNGDGNKDIISLGGSTANVKVFRGNGNGTFAAPIVAVTSSADGSLRVVDVNKDGRLDIVVAGATFRQVTVNLQNGGGTFDSSITSAMPSLPGFTLGASPIDFSVGDLDGDGDLDIAAATDSTQGSCSGFPPSCTSQSRYDVVLLDGDGAGAFTFAESFPGGPVVEIADVNHDGISDLVHGAVVNLLFRNAQVRLGTGAGAFASPVAVPFNDVAVEDIEVVDMDRDGHLDLLVTNNVGPNHAAIVRGKGDGTFHDAERHGYTRPNSGLPPVAAIGIASGDFNFDGGMDFLTIGNQSTVAVYVNTQSLRPTAVTGPPQTVTTDLAGSALVLLDGSASTGAGTKTYTWKKGSVQLASGTEPIAAVTLTGFGPHNITLTVATEFGSSTMGTSVTLEIPTTGGTPGVAGVAGLQGPRGEKGDRGDKGETGDPGEPGARGEPGDKGETGDQGEIGDKGEPGDKGPIGDAGDAGPQGLQGPSGPMGPEGEAGARGAAAHFSIHRVSADLTIAMPSTGQLIYLADSAQSAITATLPPAADAAGRMIAIKHSIGRRRVFVQPSTGEAIDGARSPLPLPDVNDSVTLLSNGSHWIVIYRSR